MPQHSTSYAHDDGLFSFQLPASWSHQIEKDGTQVFWHQSSGTGTLRVSSLTYQKTSDLSAQPASEVLGETSPVTIRSDGVAWTHYRADSSENGQPIIMYWWKLAHFIPPKYFRVAFFSFTIFAYEEPEPGTRGMLEYLSTHVPRTVFGSLREFELG